MEELTLKKLFSKEVSLEELATVGNGLAVTSMQAAGAWYAVFGDGPHHFRDGLLIFAAGRLCRYGTDIRQYVRNVYKKSDRADLS